MPLFRTDLSYIAPLLLSGNEIHRYYNLDTIFKKQYNILTVVHRINKRKVNDILK